LANNFPIFSVDFVGKISFKPQNLKIGYLPLRFPENLRIAMENNHISNFRNVPPRQVFDLPPLQKRGIA